MDRVHRRRQWPVAGSRCQKTQREWRHPRRSRPRRPRRTPAGRHCTPTANGVILAHTTPSLRRACSEPGSSFHLRHLQALNAPVVHVLDGDAPVLTWPKGKASVLCPQVYHHSRDKARAIHGPWIGAPVEPLSAGLAGSHGCRALCAFIPSPHPPSLVKGLRQ